MPFFCSPFACLRRKRDAKNRSISHLELQSRRLERPRKNRHHPRYINSLSTPSQWSQAVITDTQALGLIPALKRHVARLGHEALYRPDELTALLSRWIDVQNAIIMNTRSQQLTPGSSSIQSLPPLLQMKLNLSSSRLQQQQLASSENTHVHTQLHSPQISMIRTDTNQNSSGVQVIKVSNCQPHEPRELNRTFPIANSSSGMMNNNSATLAPSHTGGQVGPDSSTTAERKRNDATASNDDKDDDDDKFVDVLETPLDTSANQVRQDGTSLESPRQNDISSTGRGPEHASQMLPQLPSEVMSQLKPRHKPKPGFPIPDVVERDETPVTVYPRDPLLQSGPLYTFVARTSVGVTNVIKFALREGFGILHDSSLRGLKSEFSESESEYHQPPRRLHTSDQTEAALSSFPAKNDTDSNNTDRFVRVWLSRRGEFNQIDLVRVLPSSEPTSLISPSSSHSVSPALFSTAHVRIGATVSAAQVRAWCARSGEHGWNVKFNDDDSDELDIRSIVAVELFNCGAELQTVCDRTIVTAVADCFGCLGVVTARVVEARRVCHAVVMPEKPLLLFDAVPPYRRTDISPNVLGHESSDGKNDALTANEVEYTSDGVDAEIRREEERELEFMRFYVRCKRDFAQFTWIPFQKQCWVHCWDASSEQVMSSSHELGDEEEEEEVDNLDQNHGRNGKFEIGGVEYVGHAPDDGNNGDNFNPPHWNNHNVSDDDDVNGYFDEDDYDDDDDDDDDDFYRSSSSALLHNELREGGRRHAALERFVQDAERMGLLSQRDGLDLCGHSALLVLPSGDVVRSNDQDASYLWRVATGDCPWHRIEREDEPQDVVVRDGDDGSSNGDLYVSARGLDSGIEYNRNRASMERHQDQGRQHQQQQHQQLHQSDEMDELNSLLHEFDTDAHTKTCALDIEIAGQMDGSPDYSVCQRVWWIAINAVYDALPGLPVRRAVQMRITKPCTLSSLATSSVSLTAPSSPSVTSSGHHQQQKQTVNVTTTAITTSSPDEHINNHHDSNNNIPRALRPQLFAPFGTCTLLLTTGPTTPDADWEIYVKHVVDACVCLTHPITGRPLNVRTRPMATWPKAVHNVPAQTFLQMEYKKDIIAFKKTLAAACVDAGYNLGDALGVFATREVRQFLGVGETEKRRGTERTSVKD